MDTVEWGRRRREEELGAVESLERRRGRVDSGVGLVGWFDLGLGRRGMREGREKRRGVVMVR